MSAERLRQAADRLDTVSALITVDPAMGVIVTEQVRRLLRTIAAEAVCTCPPAWTERRLRQPGCPAHDVMIDTIGDAEALADAILEERA